MRFYNPFKSNRTIEFLYSVVKQNKILLFLFLLSITFQVVSSCVPYFVKLSMDAFSDSSRGANFFYPVIMIVMCCLIKDTLLTYMGFTVAKRMPFIKSKVREALFSQICSLQYKKITKIMYGNIVNKLVSIASATDHAICATLYSLIPIVIALLITLYLLSNIDYHMSILMAIWFCLHMSSNFIIVSKARKKFEKAAEATSAVSGHLIDCVSNMLAVKMFLTLNYEKENLKKIHRSEILLSSESLLCIEKLFLLQRCMFLVYFVSVLSFVIHKWSANLATIGDISLTITSSLDMIAQLYGFSYLLGKLYKESGIIENALSIIHHDHMESGFSSSDNKQSRIKGKIEFRSVSFFYDKKKIINDISFTIETNDKICIKGLSGIGKTSILSLISGLQSPDSGEIYIDNLPISKYHYSDIRNSISIVPQEPLLFNRSVIDNIRYGNLNASYEDIVEASKIANCHDFIVSMKDGYDTAVGEKGTFLSGGQKQRICIARALLKDANILILDEPFSALDSANEDSILSRIMKLYKDKVVIIVTHKHIDNTMFDEVITLS